MAKQGIIFVSKDQLNPEQVNKQMTAIPPAGDSSSSIPDPRSEFQKLLHKEESPRSKAEVATPVSESSPNQQDTQSQNRVSHAPQPESKQSRSDEKLQNLENQSDVELFRIKAWLPDMLFPDEVVIDASKVSVITNVFFASARVRSVAYDDILNVTVSYVPFFATLEVADRYFTQEPIMVNWLKKEDAIRARRIIQGLIIAKREGVNFHHIPPRELLEKVENLGSTN